jgi:hypothetical protein
MTPLFRPAARPSRRVRRAVSICLRAARVGPYAPAARRQHIDAAYDEADFLAGSLGHAARCRLIDLAERLAVAAAES